MTMRPARRMSNSVVIFGSFNQLKLGNELNSGARCLGRSLGHPESSRIAWQGRNDAHG